MKFWFDCFSSLPVLLVVNALPNRNKSQFSSGWAEKESSFSQFVPVMKSNRGQVDEMSQAGWNH